jgi:hypothetical protein
MAGAIGNFVSYLLLGGETESIHEKRHRRAHLRAIETERGAGARADYRNSAITFAAMQQGVSDDDDSDLASDDGGLHFDPRAFE